MVTFSALPPRVAQCTRVRQNAGFGYSTRVLANPATLCLLCPARKAVEGGFLQDDRSAEPYEIDLNNEPASGGGAENLAAHAHQRTTANFHTHTWDQATL